MGKRILEFWILKVLKWKYLRCWLKILMLEYEIMKNPVTIYVKVLAMTVGSGG